MKGGKFYKNYLGTIFYVFNDRKKENFVEAYSIKEGLDYISRIKVHFKTLTPLSDQEETKLLDQINFDDLFNNT